MVKTLKGDKQNCFSVGLGAAHDVSKQFSEKIGKLLQKVQVLPLLNYKDAKKCQTVIH